MKRTRFLALAMLLLGGAMACAPSAQKDNAKDEKGKKEPVPIAGGDKKEDTPTLKMQPKTKSPKKDWKNSPESDPRFNHGVSFQWLAFLPDGKQLISASPEAGLILWDLESGKLIRVLESSYPWSLSPLTLSRDGKLLFGADGKLWDVPTGKIIKKLEGTPKSPLIGIALSGDKKYALYSGVYNELIFEASFFFLWDLSRGEVVRNLNGVGYAAALSSDGFLGLSASFSMNTEKIKVWDLKKGVLLRTFEHKDISDRLSFSEDDKVVYSFGKAFAAWDVATGKLIQSIDGLRKHGVPVAFSGDRRFYLTVTTPEVLLTNEDVPYWSVILWELATGKMVKKLNYDQASRDDVYELSPDGKKIAIGGKGLLQIWDLETNQMSMDLRLNLPRELLQRHFLKKTK